jgi:G3E family GTPase
MVGAVETATKSSEHDQSHAECKEEACQDPTHNHSHDHGHVECKEEACQDPTHNHSHDHGHVECKEEACQDPTHDHSHSTTAQERFGITSFIYRRRRPFHPIRLSGFLQSLGKLSVSAISDLNTASKADTSNPGLRTAILRSKGFVWMATSSAAAYFMSHAGQYLELVALGRWWSDIPREEWPAEAEAEITVDFEGIHGDRRQEVVFIGQFDDKGASSKRALEDVLDYCLLTDDEMRTYESLAGSDVALRTHFVKG